MGKRLLYTKGLTLHRFKCWNSILAVSLKVILTETKYLGRSTLREEGLIPAHSSGSSPIVGKAWRQEQRRYAGGSLSVSGQVRKQRKGNVSIHQLSSFSAVFGLPGHGMGPLVFRVGLFS